MTNISTSNSNSRLAHCLPRSLSVKCDLAILLLALLVVSLTPTLQLASVQSTGIKFNDVMAIQYIGAGTVKRAGNADNTHYWLVKDRPAAGIVRSGNVFASGIFAFIYSGGFMPDRSGRAKGDLTVATPTRATTAFIEIALNDRVPFRRLTPWESSPMTSTGIGILD